MSQGYKDVRGVHISWRMILLSYEEGQRDGERKVRGARNFIVQ